MSILLGIKTTLQLGQNDEQTIFSASTDTFSSRQAITEVQMELNEHLTKQLDMLRNTNSSPRGNEGEGLEGDGEGEGESDSEDANDNENDNKS